MRLKRLVGPTGSKMFRFFAALLLFAATSLPTYAQIIEGKRVALVIGNGAYQDKENVLANPPRDAKAIANKLRALGFSVTEAIDQDLMGMGQAMRAFSTDMQGAVQYNLGLAYETGEGVEKGMVEAVRWYHKAADQGNAWAQNRLGF